MHFLNWQKKKRKWQDVAMNTGWETTLKAHVHINSGMQENGTHCQLDVATVFH